MQWLASQNYDIYEFDCERWRSEEKMYSDIGPVLRFSEWWGPESGCNINALDDCLTDLRARNEVRAGKVFLKVSCCRPYFLYRNFVNITHSVSTLMIQQAGGRSHQSPT